MGFNPKVRLTSAVYINTFHFLFLAISSNLPLHCEHHCIQRTIKHSSPTRQPRPYQNSSVPLQHQHQATPKTLKMYGRWGWEDPIDRHYMHHDYDPYDDNIPSYHPSPWRQRNEDEDRGSKKEGPVFKGNKEEREELAEPRLRGRQASSLSQTAQGGEVIIREGLHCQGTDGEGLQRARGLRGSG